MPGTVPATVPIVHREERQVRRQALQGRDGGSSQATACGRREVGWQCLWPDLALHRPVSRVVPPHQPHRLDLGQHRLPLRKRAIRRRVLQGETALSQRRTARQNNRAKDALCLCAHCAVDVVAELKPVVPGRRQQRTIKVRPALLVATCLTMRSTGRTQSGEGGRCMCVCACMCVRVWRHRCVVRRTRALGRLRSSGPARAISAVSRGDSGQNVGG